jgi:thiol-disulfide isomerase/thioredoxin
VAVDKRILAASLAGAVVISVAGGWALSRSGDDSADDSIEMVPNQTYTPPSLGNAQVTGEQLPDVTIRDTQGNDISTAELLGQPLVINVWATSCAACKEEMPALARVQHDYAGSVRFIGLNQLTNTQSALDFAADKGVQYELMADSTDGAFLRALGISALPYTLFVAPDGTILAQKGVALSEAQIRAAVVDSFF